MKKLPDQQELFCKEYIVDLNATQAAIRAGYAERSARQMASRLLTKDNITSRIQELMDKRAKKVEVTSETVLSELLLLAKVDISAAFDDSGFLKPLKEMPEDVRRSIAGIDVSELFDSGQGDQKSVIGFNKKIRFWDKTKSLELLGKHLKLFTDKTEITGKDGGPLEITALTDEQLDARLKELETK